MLYLTNLNAEHSVPRIERAEVLRTFFFSICYAVEKIPQFFFWFSVAKEKKRESERAKRAERSN